MTDAAGTRPQAVQRTQGGSTAAAVDRVAEEAPVALVFNGISHAVLMATPLDLEDLGLGFALSEGLIARAADCHDIEVQATPAGWEVRLQVSQRSMAALAARRRTLQGRTGCGLCGVESLAALGLDQLRSVQGASPISPPQVVRAVAALPGLQVLNAQTGSCHAAAWAGLDGQLQVAREDLGRHNALDKLIGHLAAARRLGEPGLVVVSSRASYEMVSKCLRVGIATLAAISAPTSLAIDIAQRHGLQLFGFCRGDSVVAYGAPGA